MSHPVVIEMFSPAWWKFLSATIAIVALLIVAGKKVTWLKEIIRISAGVILLTDAIALHAYLIYTGQWNLQTSLPLQLCSLSGILSGIVLLWRNQNLYELLLYWGIPGALYSLLTPEMTQGSGRFFIYEYYISHGGIIFSALYLSLACKMRPSEYSWLKIFLYSQLLLPLVGLADYYLHANYMFLRGKPEVSNPFVIGEWPWYIFALEAAMLLHFTLVYLPFYFFKTENCMMRSVGIFFLLLSYFSSAQERTQTVRGRVTDKETGAPLPFATVALFADSTVLKQGALSDTNGYFRIVNVSLGRYFLKASLIGYKAGWVGDVIVNSGKETIVNVTLEESLTELQAVEISGVVKSEALNDMTMGSARMFSVDETNRYAGSRSDPARMTQNFAGVQGSDDSRNDIVVRGNSPLGVLWRINGVDVPNPNHFAVPGTTGGGVTMLNSKAIDNSDFLTGAFPAEFGNTTAAVFDLKFRNGNNEKHEFTAQLGFLGTELSAEGPLSKKNKSSFLFAYRYSTLQLFDALNIDIGTQAVPNYQDVSFKLNFPKSNFSVFGIGGASRINILVSEYTEPVEELYGENNTDQDFRTSLGMIGATKMFITRSNAYWKLTLSYQKSKAFTSDDYVYRGAEFQVDSIVPDIRYDFITGRLSADISFNKKFSAASSIRTGVDAVRMDFDLQDSTYNRTQYVYERRLDFNGNTYLLQPYFQYKHKFSERVTLNAGLHGQFLVLNNSAAIEPRVGLRWNLKENQSLNIAAGLHSQMQPYYIYFHQVPDASGNPYMQNHSLDFTRSMHYVLGYDYSFKTNSRIKIETYYAQLYDVPVAVSPSSYSVLNEGAEFSRFFPPKLVNEGTGRNYGLEFTYEKFFSKTYFLLFTSSLYDSKYKGSDGVERSTAFNGNYAANLLGGKEFALGKSKNTVLSTGIKITYAGGLRYTPVDTAASSAAGEIVEVDSLRNTEQFKDYFRLDLKLGIKINAKKITHEIAFDLVNVLNTKNVLRLTYFYDPSHPEQEPIKEIYQLGFLPLFYYKIDF